MEYTTKQKLQNLDLYGLPCRIPDPIALCEEHAFGHIVLHRFTNNDGKVLSK